MDEKAAEIVKEASNRLSRAGQFGRGNAQPAEESKGRGEQQQSTPSDSHYQKQYFGFGQSSVYLEHDEDGNPIANICDQHGVILGEISGVTGADALKVIVTHLES